MRTEALQGLDYRDPPLASQGPAFPPSRVVRLCLIKQNPFNPKRLGCPHSKATQWPREAEVDTVHMGRDHFAGQPGESI